MSSRESQTNRTLTERLSTHNVATLRFDFVGHGLDKSPLTALTTTRCLQQVDGAIGWLKRTGYARIGLVGSSFGGWVAMRAAARHPTLFALGLKCPVVDYPPLWEGRLGTGGMQQWKESGTLALATPEGRARLSYAFYEDLLCYPIAPVAAAIRSPVFIFHGQADEDVPATQSEQLAALLSSPTDLTLLPNADHEFSNPTDFSVMIDGLIRGFCGCLESCEIADRMR
jgi:pimeloyl-ACP methyl ester carboxylesterase